MEALPGAAGALAGAAAAFPTGEAARAGRRAARRALSVDDPLPEFRDMLAEAGKPRHSVFVCVCVLCGAGLVLACWGHPWDEFTAVPAESGGWQSS